MAIFTIKDLAKAKYKQVFIDKIRAKEPMLLENTKAFEVLECPEKCSFGIWKQQKLIKNLPI